MALTCHTCGSTYRGKKALEACVGSHLPITPAPKVAK